MKHRRYYLDMPDDDVGIAVGDLLIGPKACQVVVDAWPTETKSAVNRWTIIYRSLGPRPLTRAEWKAFRSHGRVGAREVHHHPKPRR